MVVQTAKGQLEGARNSRLDWDPVTRWTHGPVFSWQDLYYYGFKDSSLWYAKPVTSTVRKFTPSLRF